VTTASGHRIKSRSHPFNLTFGSRVSSFQSQSAARTRRVPKHRCLAEPPHLAVPSLPRPAATPRLPRPRPRLSRSRPRRAATPLSRARSSRSAAASPQHRRFTAAAARHRHRAVQRATTVEPTLTLATRTRCRFSERNPNPSHPNPFVEAFFFLRSFQLRELLCLRKVTSLP
jgi:hypothetical protein